MGFGAPPGVTKHTELTDKEVAAIIDHADLSVSDAKLASGVGLTDGQLCKLPTAVLDQILKRGALAWEVGAVPAPVLEGDYSTWVFRWKQSTGWGISFGIKSVSENNDLIIIFDGYSGENILFHTLSTGTRLSETPHLIYGWDQVNSASVLGKYFATVIENGATGHPDLKIYKNAVLIQTIDLFNACSWNNVTTDYVVSINSSGKYIFVYNEGSTPREYALFRGS